MKEIVTQEQNTASTVQETMKLCQMLMKTPHYQKMGQEGIFAIVQKSKAVGVDPLDALNGGMFYVQGKVEMTATMMNDLIRRHGHSITKDKKSNEQECILHGRRKDNGDTWSESFSLDDAKKAGIYRNQWLKYPKDMLFARALSRLARQLFPDVIKGCYVEKEMQQAVGQDNEATEVEWKEETREQLGARVKEHVALDHVEYFDEYLSMVEEKINKPLAEVVDKWLSDPEPLKAHYQKWVSKKYLENNFELEYEEKSEPGQARA